MENNLEKKLQERYISQGMDTAAALYKASNAVRKAQQKRYTKDFFVGRIHEKPIMLQRLCEHIVLRPNDNRRSFGEKGFQNMVQAVEETLEMQKDSELYWYYHDMKNHEHDFHDFDTWKIWGRKVS